MAAEADLIETFHLAVFERDELARAGFQIENTPKAAITPIEELRERHHDLRSLDMNRICELATSIAQKVRHGRSDVDWYRFKERQILGMLREAVEGGRLHPSDLKDKVRAQIGTV